MMDWVVLLAVLALSVWVWKICFKFFLDEGEIHGDVPTEDIVFSAIFALFAVFFLPITLFAIAVVWYVRRSRVA